MQLNNHNSLTHSPSCLLHSSQSLKSTLHFPPLHFPHRNSPILLRSDPMAAAAAASFSQFKPPSFILSPSPKHSYTSPSSILYPLSHTHFPKASIFISRKSTPITFRHKGTSLIAFSGGGGADGGSVGGGGGGGGGGGDEDAEDKNRAEAIMALAQVGRSIDTIPKDLAAAIQAGRIPGSIVYRFFELEKSPFLSWLLNFAGFKERLLADDLFLTKVGIECGVGIFTKTAAELEKRRENFSKELDFVFADVVMAIIADFMLVWLPAPTVSLRPALATSVGGLNKFFYGCPDNAFQVALAGTSYSALQRLGAVVRNGAKLFVVGTSASLIGTGVTNLLISARKAIDKSFAGEAEDVPILSTSAAYGVYMSVSSNLRYQILAGVVEQRILEPLLHEQKLLLSAICFVVRTGNTFLGSLMWVDYARWTGIQKVRE